jgi:hypothetical protein
LVTRQTHAVAAFAEWLVMNRAMTKQAAKARRSKKPIKAFYRKRAFFVNKSDDSGR